MISQAGPLVLVPGFPESPLEAASAHRAWVLHDFQGSFLPGLLPLRTKDIALCPTLNHKLRPEDHPSADMSQALSRMRGCQGVWFFWFTEHLWSHCSGDRASNAACYLMCNNYTVINHTFRCCLYKWDHWRIFISFVMQRQTPNLLHVYRAPLSRLSHSHPLPALFGVPAKLVS